MELSQRKCIPCEDKDAKLLSKEEAIPFVAELDGWILNEEGTMITKELVFDDFFGAVNFVDQVADVAEEEQHHPDIHIYYDKVVLELYTHSLNGLSENDFIVAAKIDALWM
jgi:4a-hydroxytetrahydrobiopterin dehydratase